MPDDVGAERGEDDERLMLDSIFPVRLLSPDIPNHQSSSFHITGTPPSTVARTDDRGIRKKRRRHHYCCCPMEHNHRAARREPPTLGPLPVCVPHLTHSLRKKNSDWGPNDRWNAARAMSRYLERTPTLYRGLKVLELGAGAGLPGLVVAKSGARNVCAPFLHPLFEKLMD